jgi:hypothetical protein
MKIRSPLLLCVLSASLLYSQTQAPDASPDGPLLASFGGYSAGAAAIDNEILPGCGFAVSGAAWAAGDYDCKTQVTGEFYVPNPLDGARPLIVFLHGNHGTCGHAYNPPPREVPIPQVCQVLQGSTSASSSPGPATTN